MPTPAPAMPPLPQDVEQFLTWMTDQKGFSPATISAYRTDLLQFEGWLHREQHSLARPGELEKYHFQDYSAHLFHEGQARSSIGRKLSALRSLFRYLMKMKKIDKNPAKLVRNPKRELRHPTALNVDQMFTLLDEASVESGGAAGLDGSRQAEQAVTDREHAGHTRDLALAELLYGSGLRISEALDLDVDDVDPASGFIRVIGKGSKERIAPLSDTSVRALFLWLRVRALIAPPAEKA
ncbi:site-specific integrase, partial [Bilophila wadsworthia]